MAKIVCLGLVICSVIAIITAQTNVCFDDKEHLEKLSVYQDECGKIQENVGNEPKMLMCVMNKLGILNEMGDAFDFDKVKEYVLTKIEDQQMKTELKTEMEKCEEEHPTGDLGFYSCFVASFRRICYQ